MKLPPRLLLTASTLLHAASAMATDISDLIATDQRMQRAFVDRDVAVLDEILTDDYVLVLASGAERRKAQIRRVRIYRNHLGDQRNRRLAGARVRRHRHRRCHLASKRHRPRPSPSTARSSFRTPTFGPVASGAMSMRMRRRRWTLLQRRQIERKAACSADAVLHGGMRSARRMMQIPLVAFRESPAPPHRRRVSSPFAGSNRDRLVCRHRG